MGNASRMRDLARLHLGETHPLVAASLSHLGALHHTMGDDLSALPLLQESLGILRSSLGDEHELVAQGTGALIELGVPANRLSAQAFGEEMPAASNGTATGRQLNRRVEIVFAAQVENAPIK